MAKYVYPAVFTHEAEGGYSITFPDLPDCATSAETLEEGIEMAADALCLILYDMLDGQMTAETPAHVPADITAAAKEAAAKSVKPDTVGTDGIKH